jgi:hypothetical protein
VARAHEVVLESEVGEERDEGGHGARLSRGAAHGGDESGNVCVLRLRPNEQPAGACGGGGLRTDRHDRHVKSEIGECVGSGGRGEDREVSDRE